MRKQKKKKKKSKSRFFGYMFDPCGISQFFFYFGLVYTSFSARCFVSSGHDIYDHNRFGLIKYSCRKWKMIKIFIYKITQDPAITVLNLFRTGFPPPIFGSMPPRFTFPRPFKFNKNFGDTAIFCPQGDYYTPPETRKLMHEKA